MWKNFNLFAEPEKYGQEYVGQQLQDIITILVKSQNYLFRISAIRGLQICGRILHAEKKLVPVLMEVLSATKEEKVPNVQMELNTCLAMTHQYLEKEFLNGEVRDRLEKYTIDPEFDTSYFAKKALVVIFNMSFSEFFSVDKKELKFELYDY